MKFETQLLGVRRVASQEYVSGTKPMRIAWRAAFEELSKVADRGGLMALQTQKAA